jgi:hypothetical protein
MIKDERLAKPVDLLSSNMAALAETIEHILAGRCF